MDKNDEDARPNSWSRRLVCVITCGQWWQERRSWSRRLVCVTTYGVERQRSTEPKGGHEILISRGTESQAGIEGCTKPNWGSRRHEERTFLTRFRFFCGSIQKRVCVCIGDVNTGVACTHTTRLSCARGPCCVKTMVKQAVQCL